jgi:hypothetical protein
MLSGQDGDDDAFGRGAHGTSEGAQIKAGLILLKKREDHRSVAVRAKRALIGRFAVEKRGNGTIKHERFPWLSGSATLSVTIDAWTMRRSRHHALPVPTFLLNTAHFQKIDAVISHQPCSVPPDFSDNLAERLLQTHSRRNDLQMGVLSHNGHPVRHLLTWRWPMLWFRS